MGSVQCLLSHRFNPAVSLPPLASYSPANCKPAILFISAFLFALSYVLYLMPRLTLLPQMGMLRKAKR